TLKKTIALLIAVLLLMMYAAAACAEIFVNQPLPEDWNTRETMRLTFFASGRTDAMMLETAGEVMMIDGGSAQYASKLINYMKSRGITHFKYLFNTHPHNDHVQGLYKMVEAGFTADEFLSPFKINHKHSFQQKTVKVLKKAGIPYRQVYHGDVIQFGKAQLHLYRWDELRTMNGMSGMLNIYFGDRRVLLCSDITGATQDFFMENVDVQELQAEIVKAPHHGISGFDDKFVAAVNPQLIIATVPQKKGKRIELQSKGLGLPCMFSGDGRIEIETDGTDWYVTQFMGEF
ncbi:MAG: MBL fold metallo-hydrolase, partial [Clostridia bacterium]|nr:MBL fold metallo-hydrolase [Clostridia bacterium]